MIDEARDELAQLQRELKQAEDRAAAVHDVIQTVARSTFDLETVLQTVIDRAVLLCHADTGNIARRVGDVYRMAAFTSFGPEYERMVRDHIYEPGRGSVIGRAVLERGVVHIIDVLEDPDYSLTNVQSAGGYRTALGVPMLKDGEPIGAMAVGRNTVKPFSEAEVALLQTFADQVVVAIENVRLFQTVERQRIELARFAPQVASLLSSDEGERLLAGHRREITTLFSDLRGFTAFAETAEPEEVLDVLRAYHLVVGEVVTGHGGTVEHFAGDGLMAFYNDPVPDPEHQIAAVRTAVEVREAHRRARLRVAPAGIRPRSRCRHHDRLRDARPYRFRGALRLRRDREHGQPRLPAQRCRRARRDPHQPAAPSGPRGSHRDGGRRRAATQRLQQARRRLPGHRGSNLNAPVRRWLLDVGYGHPP